MFMKKKFILGVLYLSAATAQGKRRVMRVWNNQQSAPSDYTATDARVEGHSAIGEGGNERLALLGSNLVEFRDNEYQDSYRGQKGPPSYADL
jgi:hypothetical protein